MRLKVIKKHNSSDMCAVCGYKNPYSLKAEFFEVDNNYLVGLTQGMDEHQSYPNRMHGGIICALLDETIGRAIQINQPETWGVTSELTVKYRKPTPLNQPLKIVGKIVKDTSRVFIGEGFVEDKEGNLLAQATATYVKIPLQKIVNEDNTTIFWELMKKDTDPDFIEVNNIK